MAGPDAPRFVYLLAYEDYAQREACWAGFYGDPEWWRVRAETNAGQEMVERHDLFFLKPNAAWEADEPRVATLEGLHELVFVEVAPGKGADAVSFLREQWRPAIEAAGGRFAAAWDMVAGAGMQKLVLLHAWGSAAAWHEGRIALENMPEIKAEWARQRAQLGTTVFLRSEVNLLQPGTEVAADLGRHG